MRSERGSATDGEKTKEKKEKDRQGKREVIVEGGMKGARKDKGKKWKRLWRGSARERKGKRDVWTSLRRDGWVSLEQTRVRGIIKRFIRLLSRSYSALFIRPVSPRFFFLATTAPLFSLPFYKSPRAEQFDKGCGVGDETEIKKRREGGYCGARGPWLKYTSEPRGFLLISPDPYVSSPSPTIPFLSSLYYAVSFFLSPFPFFFFFFFLPFLLSIFISSCFHSSGLAKPFFRFSPRMPPCAYSGNSEWAAIASSRARNWTERIFYARIPDLGVLRILESAKAYVVLCLVDGPC